MHIGSVHGRFQIFHLEHLKYVREAYKRCDCLIIGITGIRFLLSPNNLAASRMAEENNPFSYFERMAMIRAALQADGLDLSRISFAPFPIEDPTKLEYFIPRSVHCFTTIREEWNVTKIAILKELGYAVTILYTDLKKAVTGSKIRSLIKAGDKSWRRSVPEAVMSWIEEHQASSRIK